jgi:hypothetical protein
LSTALLVNIGSFPESRALIGVAGADDVRVTPSRSTLNGAKVTSEEFTALQEPKQRQRREERERQIVS